MFGSSLIGAGMVGYSLYALFQHYTGDKRVLKKDLNDVFETNKIETKIDMKVFQPKITSVKKTPHGWDVEIELPKGYSFEKFLEKLSPIEQATASRIRPSHIQGRKIKLELGCIPVLDRMDYDESLVKPGELSIPYHTPFGTKYLNFHDESVCHLIVAGATRMGKTVFIRLLFTHLMAATEGNIKFFYINNKVEDFFPLQNIPQIPEPAESIDQAIDVMYSVVKEITKRKEKLRKSKDAVNVKQYNQLHPEDKIAPMFVVFDEYGRFADDSDESQELQGLIQMISETAGYLDIHLVIATQRPDATTVLKPRIRANILSRVCFQTADEANSKIVIHTGDAHNLGSVRGRAIILDGMPELGQIPYISEEQTIELLNPFRNNADMLWDLPLDDDRRESNETERARQEDSPSLNQVPSFVTGSNWLDCVPGGGETTRYGEPDYEAPKPKRVRSSNPKTKR